MRSNNDFPSWPWGNIDIYLWWIGIPATTTSLGTAEGNSLIRGEQGKAQATVVLSRPVPICVGAPCIRRNNGLRTRSIQ